MQPWNRGKARDQQAVLRYTHLLASGTSLTLARRRHEIPKFGEAEMIARTAQIVHNDILVNEIKSFHDHLRKCDSPSVKRRKTRN